jgi:hypothetical protein
MSRLPAVSLLFAASVYAGQVGPAACGQDTTPTFTLMVNSTMYTNFNMEGSPSFGCNVNGTFGSVPTTGYQVTVSAFTMSDPVIDFGMNFADTSDPTVTLMISTPYSGGPFTSLVTTGSGTLTDVDGDGAASALPLPLSAIEQVKVNGVTVATLNPGCSFSGQTAGFSQDCPSFSSLLTAGNFPSSGTLELDVVFNLSTGDTYNVSGSTGFVTTPEPGSGISLVAGLLSMIGLAQLRLAT